jgi:hypothetical protein
MPITATPAPPAACHRCGQPSTNQWQREATADEAEQHWAAAEQNIRASNDGRPAVGYAADRTDSVRKTVHGCADHAMDPERATIVHAHDCGGHGACRCVSPALAEQIRKGIAEAERGETHDLGSFAQYLDDEDAPAAGKVNDA